MNAAERLSEQLAVVATVDPQDAATTAKSSDYVDMSKFHRAIFIALSGALTGTMDAKLEQAQDSSGTGVKDITGKSITQFAATDDNKQAVIELTSEELDLAGAFTHARITVTPTGGTTNLLGAIALAGNARFEPVDGDDLASVAQIVG